MVLSYPSCEECRYCRSGHNAYCEHAFEICFGGSRLDGSNALGWPEGEAHEAAMHGHFFGQSSFATHAVVDQSSVVKVPDDLPLELLAPLGCGFQTGAGAILNSLEVRPGSHVAVFGTGAVGLAAIMAAKVAGAASIIAVDINASRLAVARELGATHTINGRDGNTAEQIRGITGIGADYVLEITARPEMLKLAVDVLAPLGTAALIGGAPAGAEAPVDMNVLLNGRMARGIIQGDAVPQVFIPRLIELYRAGQFPIDRLVRFFDFEQINDAVEQARKGDAIKAVLRVAAS
ncbi:aryl-alcohol dehydrogenase [Pseudomonas sp. ATCC 13867]|nr:aryl-alcohol dehydrogenase [Pseudomonas sp. ATCC 13867]